MNKYKFEIGDWVRIERRKPENLSGLIDWNKPNGDVGKIGLIRERFYWEHATHPTNRYGVHSAVGEYFGLFDEDDLTPHPPKESLKVGGILGKVNEAKRQVNDNERVDSGVGIGDFYRAYLEANREEIANSFNIKTMDRLTDIYQRFAHAIMSEPQKSFVELGITNRDGSLTNDGIQLFLNWLFQKNAAEFNKEVVTVLRKEEERKKK